jgi:hypothetical protein
MIHLQDTKFVHALAPVSLNGAGTTIAIDTLGYDYCTFVVSFGLLGAADNTVLKVQEADALTDANTLTSGADVTGLVVGTSLNIAGSTSTHAGDTSDGTLHLFEVDLRGRKRYLDLAITTGAAGLVAVIAILSRAEQAPQTAAQRGCAQILRA